MMANPFIEVSTPMLGHYVNQLDSHGQVLGAEGRLAIAHTEESFAYYRGDGATVNTQGMDTWSQNFQRVAPTLVANQAGAAGQVNGLMENLSAMHTSSLLRLPTE
jgi:hypothetical protein